MLDFTRAARLAAWLTVLLPAACSVAEDRPPPAESATIAGGGAGGSAPSVPSATLAEAPVTPAYPAFATTAAQLVSHGGRILSAPKVALLTYPGDPLAPVAVELVSAIGTSAYWSGATKEYGVGPAVALAPITLRDPPPSSIDQAAIETWLAAELDGGNGALPAPDGQTLYVIVYPAATTITRGSLQSCRDFGGFHAETKTTANGPVPYIAMPRCSTFAGLEGKDLLSFAMSHELVEAALDPFTKSGPAYDDVDKLHRTLALAFGGGEAGDLCPQDSTLAADIPFVVQRTWSNASAKAGHHPCVPAEPSPYFFANPVLPDLSTDGASVVTIEVGKSRTIDVQLSSDAPMALDWTVSLIDVASSLKKPAELSFVLDRSTGNNGDVLHATISTLRAGTVGVQGGYSLFLVRSVSKDKRVSLLAGAVRN
jgi:hypothetical protein